MHDYVADLKKLPEQIEMLLANQTRIQKFANRYVAAQDVFFIGRGIDYAILDLKKQNSTDIYVSSYNGRNIFILPVFNKFTNYTEFEDVCSNLDDKTGIKCIEISSSQLSKIDADTFIQKVLSLEEYTVRPGDYILAEKRFTQCFISSLLSYKNFNCAFDMILENKDSKALYDYTMHIAKIIDHTKTHDKARKDEAKRMLWKSQNQVFYTEEYPKEEAYKSLISAEDLVKKQLDTMDFISAFDYNGDGIKEYICRTKTFSSVISKKGSCLTELNVGFAGKNYCLYNQKGLFYSFFESDKNQDLIYSEKKFNSKKNELSLIADCLSQNLSITKQYQIRESGMLVQFIAKNNSSSFINTKFCVELELSIPENRLEAEFVSELKSICLEQKESKLYAKNVSFIRLYDTKSKCNFMLELNEQASCSCIKSKKTVSVMIQWKMNIDSEMSSEKTISFSIVKSKKMLNK